MTGVRNVFNYMGCFPEAAWIVDGVNGRELGLCDGLGCIHNSLQHHAFLGRAVLVPGCVATWNYTFFSASAGVCKSQWRHAKFPQVGLPSCLSLRCGWSTAGS